MVTRRSVLAFLGGAGVVVAGGGAVMALLPDSGKAGDGPPRIRYGAASCARCTMVIDDPRFAAAWRDASGAEQRFDDIGCMAVHAREQGVDGTARFWVHDFHTSEWLDASQASYATSDAIKSPMAYGIAAASSPEDARALSADEVQSWAALVGSIKARG